MSRAQKRTPVSPTSQPVAQVDELTKIHPHAAGIDLHQDEMPFLCSASG
jgi:hypothetical protein